MKKALTIFTSVLSIAILVFLFCAKESPTTVAQKHLWGAITGQVNDTKGRPLPGVQVTAGTIMALSDSAGFFVLDKVAPASYTLKVQFADFDAVKTYSAQVSAYGDSIVLQEPIQMTSRYFLLKGKIVQSSAPVPLAGVMVANQAITGLTNNAGVYILSKVSKDSSLQIISAKTGVGCAKLEGLRGIADDTTFIPNLSLQDQGGTITGTVYDTLNRPVAKAQVLALAGGLADTASSSGQYMLTNVPASEASLRIYVPDANSGLVGAISGVSVNEGKTVMGADIYLRPAGSFTNNMLMEASDMVIADTAKTITISALGLTTGSTRIESYEWYTSGGANPDTTTQNASLSVTPKTCSTFLTIAVRAVSDSGLYSARTSITIKILSTKPVVHATVCSESDTTQRDSVTILQNDMAQFRGSAIAPFGGIDTMEWIFGDGTQWIASDTSANVGHSYDTNGTFKAIFRVRDAVGNIVRDTLKIIVQKPSIPAPLYVYPNNNDTVKTTSDSVKLVWHAVSGTSIKYNVYLSKNTTPGSNEKVVSLTSDTFAYVAIVKGNRYSWKVESVSSSAQQAGVPWSFVVVSGVLNNNPPVFSTKPTDMLDTATVGKLYKDTVKAADIDGDSVKYVFNDSIIGMTLTSGVITWTPVKADTGSHTVSILAKDGKGGLDTLTWSIRVMDTAAANHMPVFTTLPAAMRDSAFVGKLYRDTVNATDPDGDSLRYAFKDSVVGMSIGIINGIIQWTPVKADTGSHTVSVFAKDGKGGLDTLTWTIKVGDTASLKPHITLQPDSLVVTAGSSFMLRVAASGNGLSYQWQQNSQNILNAMDTAYKVLSASTLKAGLYRCIVCNASGCDTSHTARVTVNNPAATIIYVKYNATGANTGASWTDADTNLQTAIDSAKATSEIWVAAGTYKPTKQFGGMGDRFRSFQMKEGVGIYGGFTGTETQKKDRNFTTHQTVLSGDIGTPNDSTDNCYHVIYNTSDLGLTANSVLDGFTISGGNADGATPVLYSGGGIYCQLCSPVIRHCVFTANFTNSYGSGIYLLNSNPLIDSCEFTANNSYGYGAGLCNDHSVSTITNCVFKNNNGTYGAAIYNTASNCKISTCQFLKNNANDGGGVWCSNSSIIISDSYFNLNSAQVAGALISQGGSLVVSNCSFILNSSSLYAGAINIVDQSDIFTNCVFANNFSAGYAGVIYAGGGNINVLNSSFLSNTSNNSDGGGAIFNAAGTKLVSANSIFWNNIASTQSQDFFGFDSTNFLATYCITKQTLPNGTGYHISITDPLCGPIADNGGPVLTSALSEGSAAIDSGVYLYTDVNDSVMYNLDGKTTYYNLKGQPFTPTGTVTRINATDARGVARPQGYGIDIGAFEKE